jgi:hypothetical protein
MARYRFRLLEIEAELSPRDQLIFPSWKTALVGFLTSVAAALLIALLL